jgi:hypothetical protein
VGLVVYVRNDPVNFIDPDGRNVEAIEARIRIEEWLPGGYAPELYWYEDVIVLVIYPTIISGSNYVDYEPSSGAGKGIQAYQDLMKPENLKPALNGRIGKEIELLDGTKQKPCEAFLTALFSAAKIDVDINQFIDSTSQNVKYGAQNYSGLLGKPHGWTNPSTFIGYVYDTAFSQPSSPVAGLYGDYLSTTIHEGFHVISKLLDGSDKLIKVLATVMGEQGYRGSTIASSTDRFFDKYCGPNPVAFR